MSSINRAWVVLAIAMAGPGCGRILPTIPRQYTLHVNVAEHGKSYLCWREVDASAVKDVDATTAAVGDFAEKCTPWAVQTLDAPGTLTVQLDGASPTDKYDLRISQFSREASPEDARKIIQEVLKRSADLVSTAIESANGGEAGKTLATKIKTEIERQSGGLAALVLPSKSAGAEAPLVPVSERFAPYLYEQTVGGATTIHLQTADLTRAAQASSMIAAFNAPAAEPPPRAFVFSEEDRAYLKGRGVPDAEVTRFVNDWCSAASFAAPAFTAQYAALATTPDRAVVKDVLDVKPAEVAASLLQRGPADPFAAVSEPLIAEAQDWATASPGAQQFALMRLGTSLSGYLDNCAANLAAIGVAPPPGAFTTLKSNATAYATALTDIIGPIYAAGIVSVETLLPLLAASSFTTVTLEPGKLELGVGAVGTDGKRNEIATYKIPIRGIERLAIFVGPIFTMCRSGWNCFDEIKESTTQPVGGDPKRVLIRESNWADFGLGTALHVTIRSSSRWGLGAIVGYPLAAPASTSSNIIAGFGLRHSSGIELAIGVHAFRVEAIRAGYDISTPIDLEVDGNEALTPDSVTDPDLKGGMFFMLGFAPDIF